RLSIAALQAAGLARLLGRHASYDEQNEGVAHSRAVCDALATVALARTGPDERASSSRRRWAYAPRPRR
ncbi:MAG: hypothetical protein AAFV49_23640, partial [Pseudomonadota bacterium]